jgi:hypothetical protein
MSVEIRGNMVDAEGAVLVDEEFVAGNGEPERGLFKDERFLSRDDVIERYFTPVDQEKYTGPKINEKLVKFSGVGEYASLKPRTSFVMRQIRDVYDGNHIERTGRSMRDSPEGQLQNCGVAFIDEDYIDDYLADINDFFETEFTRADLASHEKFGCYVITIFGHNRQFGAAAANREAGGHPDRGMPIVAKVFRNPQFFRVLAMQATENTGLAPAMWDRSRSIVKYKEYRNRDRAVGEPPVTSAEIGKIFGVDEDQICRAERYELLPQDIKTLVVAGKLPYSGAFELDRLFSLYRAEDVIVLAHQLARQDSSTKQIVNEVRKREAVGNLSPQVRALVDIGAITLPQAQQLARYSEYGFSDKHIEDAAIWICFESPEFNKLLAMVDSDIDHRFNGEMNFFDSETMDPEERAAKIAQFEADNRARQLQLLTTRVIRDIDRLDALHKTGLIGDAADRDLIPGVFDKDLKNLLKEISEAGPEGLSDDKVANLVLDIEAIKTNLTNTETDQRIIKILSRLEGVLRSIKETSADQQRNIRKEIGEGILQLAVPEQAKAQAGLFDVA